MKILLIDQIAKVNYKYSYNLANAIKQQNVEVDMVTDQKSEADHAQFRRLKLFNTSEKNIGKIKKALNYIASMNKVIKLMKKHYDIMHTQWIIFSPLDYFFLKKIKKCNKKLVITVHDILPFNKKFYDTYFHKKIYALADCIILQTDENMQRFKQLFPTNSVPVRMIPHGNFLNYAKEKNKLDSRQNKKIESDKFVYLFFGQIKKVKGVDVLLKAYALLLNKYPELKAGTQLVIAGSIWKTDFGVCEDIIKENKLESNLKLDIRYIPDEEVDEYYALADVCVLPYYEVYQSGVLQLTYAHHRAPIVTRIPAFMDIVNEDRGFLCETGDENSLADALWQAYQHREQLDIMAENGYQYISEHYDWDTIGKKIVEIYKTCQDIEM